MPAGAAFSVYAQSPSRNAFVHTVSAANMSSATVSRQDHPGLNGLPGAAPHIAINRNGQMPTPQATVRYDSGLQRWYLLDETAATQFEIGNQYFVVVDPRRTLENCVSALLVDGFE